MGETTYKDPPKGFVPKIDNRSGRINPERAAALYRTGGIWYDAQGNRYRTDAYKGGYTEENEAKKAKEAEADQAAANQRYAEANPPKAQAPVRAEPIDLTGMVQGEEKKPGEPGTINLSPQEQAQPQQELTGIAKLREEDTLIGNAVKVATDWKTTVALVATLGAVLAAPAAAAAIGGGTGTTVASGAAARSAAVVATRQSFLKSGESIITRAVGGKVTEKFLVGKVASQALSKGAQYATNAKSAALTSSMLSKAGMGIGAASLVAGAAGTYPFSKFQLAEATDKIGIAMFQAAKAGDAEEVARLNEIMMDMTNPSVWERIIGKIPIANAMAATAKNVEAAIISSNSQAQTAFKQLEKTQAAQNEPSFEEQRAAADEAARERKVEQREDDTAFYDKINKERAETKREEREEETEYYDRIEKDRQERKAQERIEDTEYYAKIAKENRERELRERAEDTEFYEGLKNQGQEQEETPAETGGLQGGPGKTMPTTDTPLDEAKDQLEEIKGSPLTPSEIKQINDWNAGKSALNFLWLGNF